jgi:hypothetical protein
MQGRVMDLRLSPLSLSSLLFLPFLHEKSMNGEFMLFYEREQGAREMLGSSLAKNGLLHTLNC